ncbi:TPA: XRE family transcriptional regulator [Escherichia coli]
MTGWELRLWRKSMLWSREKAAREFGVTQRTWHAWENAEQVDVTVLRTTQALSVMDLLPDIHRMTKSTIIRRLENEFRDGNTGDG